MKVCAQCTMEGCLDCDTVNHCLICDNTTYDLDSVGVCR